MNRFSLVVAASLLLPAACLDVGLTSKYVNADGCTLDPDDNDDSDCTPTNWFVDADGDTFGDPAGQCVQTCETEREGYSRDALDCDDSDSAIEGPASWHIDADGDGFGHPDVITLACAAPEGFVADYGDCDDGDAAVNPDADEICDGVDNDCDRLADDADDDVVGAVTYYLDADGDGYGTEMFAFLVCGQAPPAYVTVVGDCDDGAAGAFPGNMETCDGLDNDCDGDVDFVDRPPAMRCLSTAIVKLDGEGSGDLAGRSVAGPGDVSGDGVPDIFVGAPGRDNGGSNPDAGGAYLVLGTTALDASLADAQALFVGDAGSAAGGAVSGAGDVNDDGFADLLVGAQSAGEGAGAAYLIYGPGTESLSRDAAFSGEESGDHAGVRVAAGGDVDADGFDDLLVAAHDAGGGAGKVYLLRGGADPHTSGSLADQASTVITGGDIGDAIGVGLASAELDGDGMSDLLIGSDSYTDGASPVGAIYFVYGANLGDAMNLYGDFDVRITGTNADDQAGFAAAGGDLDGDGGEDVVIGAKYEDEGGSSAGAVYVVSGGTVGRPDVDDAKMTKLVGEAEGDCAGYSAAAAGDVNGDGAADLLVGAYRSDRGGEASGAAYVVLGPLPRGTIILSAADRALISEGESQFAGISLTGLGDLDGDGLDDIAVGAEAEPGGGAAYLLFGSQL